MTLRRSFFILIVVTSCGSDWTHYTDQSDFVLRSEKVSPDGKHKLIDYQFDLGALDYSRMFWAISPVNDDKINLTEYLLPDGYKNLGWTSDNKAIIQKWKPYYYKREDIDLRSGDVLYGVELIVTEADSSER
jgi:hypothetical protein